MTGTPLQNNTAELWALLNFIEPAKFPDPEKFALRYGNITTQEQVESLQRRIAPHLLRRVKEDVAKDIPPKEETIIDVELTTMQKQYYRAIFEHNHGFLMQSLKGTAMPKLMNIQMELRKCCNHPFLIQGSFVGSHRFVTMYCYSMHSWCRWFGQRRDSLVHTPYQDPFLHTLSHPINSHTLSTSRLTHLSTTNIPSHAPYQPPFSPPPPVVVCAHL